MIGELRDNELNYFPKYFSTVSLRAYVIILLLIAGFSITNIAPVEFLVFSTVSVIFFFALAHRFTVLWLSIPEKLFERKLIITALLVRAATVIFLYFFYTYKTGSPFEFDAGDSMFYDESGQYVADMFRQGQINPFPELLKYMVISDTGFPVFVGMNYFLFFKSILVFRIVNAVFSALTCLLIYRLAKTMMDEKIARMAGVFMLVVPSLIIYSGYHLKETIMIFFVVYALYSAARLTAGSSVKYGALAGLLFSITALFLFRTVIGLAVLLAVANHLFFFKVQAKNWFRKVLVVFWLVCMFFALMLTSIKGDVDALLNESGTNQEQRMQSINIQGGNKFAKYASKSILFPVLISAPFPTFVDTSQKNIMLFSGAMFVKNCYAFFVILGLIFIFRKRLLRKHAMILSFVFSYLIIIGLSGFVLSDRFHQPLVPFYLILAALGVTKVTSRNFKFYSFYIILIGVIILGWNWVKLAGRGLF